MCNRDWKQLICWHEISAQRWEVQPWQVSGDNTCKVPPASPLQIDATMNLRLQSKATWFLFQPPGLIRSHKEKFLRLKVCKRILNLPSPGGWVGNEKVELSHAVTAEYRGNNPIHLFPSEVAGVSVWVPPSLFHWVYCAVSQRQNICWQRREAKEILHLPYERSQRSSGKFTARDKWQLVSFQDPSSGETPNGSWQRTNNVCIFFFFFLHCVRASFFKFGKVVIKGMIQKGPKTTVFWIPILQYNHRSPASLPGKLSCFFKEIQLEFIFSRTLFGSIEPAK